MKIWQMDDQLRRIVVCLNAVEDLQKRIDEIKHVESKELSEAIRIYRLLKNELSTYDVKVIEQAKYHTKKLK